MQVDQDECCCFEGFRILGLCFVCSIQCRLGADERYLTRVMSVSCPCHASLVINAFELFFKGGEGGGGGGGGLEPFPETV